MGFYSTSMEVLVDCCALWQAEEARLVTFEHSEGPARGKNISSDTYIYIYIYTEILCQLYDSLCSPIKAQRTCMMCNAAEMAQGYELYVLCTQ